MFQNLLRLKKGVGVDCESGRPNFHLNVVATFKAVPSLVWCFFAAFPVENMSYVTLRSQDNRRTR